MRFDFPYGTPLFLKRLAAQLMESIIGHTLPALAAVYTFARIGPGSELLRQNKTFGVCLLLLAVVCLNATRFLSKAIPINRYVLNGLFIALTIILMGNTAMTLNATLPDYVRVLLWIVYTLFSLPFATFFADRWFPLAKEKRTAAGV